MYNYSLQYQYITHGVSLYALLFNFHLHITYRKGEKLANWCRRKSVDKFIVLAK